LNPRISLLLELSLVIPGFAKNERLDIIMFQQYPVEIDLQNTTHKTDY